MWHVFVVVAAHARYVWQWYLGRELRARGVRALPVLRFTLNRVLTPVMRLMLCFYPLLTSFPTHRAGPRLYVFNMRSPRVCQPHTHRQLPGVACVGQDYLAGGVEPCPSRPPPSLTWPCRAAFRRPPRRRRRRRRRDILGPEQSVSTWLTPCALTSKITTVMPPAPRPQVYG